MSQLGMAAQAIDIVYQLNANEQGDAGIYHQGASPLEAVSFGPKEVCDVALRNCTTTSVSWLTGIRSSSS